MNLLPRLVRGAGVVERKLFWRYKSLWQRAARTADCKYLKIMDNTFLFNVVDDPLERANLKGRRREVYDRLVGEWKRMELHDAPRKPKSYTENFTGADMADHFGAKPVTLDPDPDRQ
jgi:hypothetical protein